MGIFVLQYGSRAIGRGESVWRSVPSVTESVTGLKVLKSLSGFLNHLHASQTVRNGLLYFILDTRYQKFHVTL